MDRDQEDLQFLGFFGIIKESDQIIITQKKLFSKITLTLILPLAFIVLAHSEISQLLFFKIFINKRELEYTKPGTLRYESLSDLVSHEWMIFWLFKLAYFVFLMVFSLLCTSAVVYTVACMYTGKDVSFKKVMSVVPKVWKKLMVTFLWNFAVSFIYNFGFGIFFLLVMAFIGFTTTGIAIIVALSIIFISGYVYITLVWQLACVVSVLEDLQGIRAMIKSKNLMKGKMGISLSLFLLVVVCSVGIGMLFQKLVVFGLVHGLGFRICIGILCLLLLVNLYLFGLVVQTVIYLVCKSYHHENIDKSSLADHLEVYLGEYVPLKSKDVQLEQLHV